MNGDESVNPTTNGSDDKSAKIDVDAARSAAELMTKLKSNEDVKLEEAGRKSDDEMTPVVEVGDFFQKFILEIFWLCKLYWNYSKNLGICENSLKLRFFLWYAKNTKTHLILLILHTQNNIVDFFILTQPQPIMD